MTYLDSGFDLFQTRVVTTSPTEMSDYDASMALSQISGSYVTDMSVDKLTTGVLNSSADLGSSAGGSYVRLDGPNNRIIIHDGTVPRIVIGKIA